MAGRQQNNATNGNPLGLRGGGRRIAVAMSGGVDSSVVAALLVDAGFQVIGLTMRLAPETAGTAQQAKTCCAGRDIQDAMRVAAHLGIRHYVLDYQKSFADHVLTDFAESYARGETPLPCVRCNQRIKFSTLLQQSRHLDCCALATGHYVRHVYSGDDPWQKDDSQLYRAVDTSRDQSYFLFTTTRAQLRYLFFPLGNFYKKEVRALAATYGLALADKPDSQDLCFVPSGHYLDMIERLRPNTQKHGDIVDKHGTILGRHNGIEGYTIGQRKGLAIQAQSTQSEPWYVIAIDSARNQLIVGKKQDLLHRSVSLKHVNWLGETQAPAHKENIQVRLRSQAPLIDAHLLPKKDAQHHTHLTVHLEHPTARTAPGQACVFYDKTNNHTIGQRLLGGGWIV